MNKYLLVFYATGVLCTFLSGASAQTAAENITDGHFPTWYGKNGAEHKAKYPTARLVLFLPSLTQKQRREITPIYMASTARYTPLHEQADELRKERSLHLQGSDEANLSLQEYSYKIAQIQKQVEVDRAQTWMAVKVKLTPSQLQELVDLARKHASKNSWLK